MNKVFRCFGCWLLVISMAVMPVSAAEIESQSNTASENQFTEECTSESVVLESYVDGDSLNVLESASFEDSSGNIVPYDSNVSSETPGESDSIELEDTQDGGNIQSNSLESDQGYSMIETESGSENGMYSAESLQAESDSVQLGIPTNITVTTGGNLTLKIEWKPGEIIGTTADKVRYLIYRSESYEGEYKNIGYTPYNTTFYYDGGGENVLETGKTYYYKVQAYSPENGDASSNLYQCEPGSGIALEVESAINEFFSEEEMVSYLREGLKNREGEIEMFLWLPEYTNGYHKTLYDKAVKENEDLSSDSSLGDYFAFHILDYAADLQDLRVEQNGLRKYKLVYCPQYYTTKEEEEQVESEVQRLINGSLGLDSNASDIEKVEAVYRYLATSATYDLSLRNNEERCSAYDALVLHKSVCQGFANAVYKLLRELGIMNRIVTGEVYYENEWRVHAWNLVRIDDVWYHLDATTEVHFVEEYGYVSYKWFLKNDADLGNTFKKDAQNFNEEFESVPSYGCRAYFVAA